MRRNGPPALLVALAVAVPVIAAEAPRPAQIVNAGTVRKTGVISLEKTDRAYPAAGLWSETRTLPKETTVRAVRLIRPTLPRGCDLVTQVRCRKGAGPWSPWSPANILSNGDLAGAAPPGARLEKGRPGAAIRRWASAAIPKGRVSVPCWSVPAPPGSDLTFAAAVSADRRASGAGVGLRLTGASEKTALQVHLTAPAGANARAWRRAAVGISVPGWARRVHGLAVLEHAKEDVNRTARVRAANGALLFRGPPTAKQVLLRDTFAAPKRWKAWPGTQITWGRGEKASATLVLKDEGPAAGAVQTGTIRSPGRGWVALRATVSTQDAMAGVGVMFCGADGRPTGEHISLRHRAPDGTYRLWAIAPALTKAPRLRLLLQAAQTAGQGGSATFHEVELAACDPPPAFTKRPPPERIPFPRPMRAEQLEIRSFLLSADPRVTPSFGGYVIETE